MSDDLILDPTGPPGPFPAVAVAVPFTRVLYTDDQGVDRSALVMIGGCVPTLLVIHEAVPYDGNSVPNTWRPVPE
jgi:hypothetical protein